MGAHTHLGHVTRVTGAAEHLVHLRQLDALVVLWKGTVNARATDEGASSDRVGTLIRPRNNALGLSNRQQTKSYVSGAVERFIDPGSRTTS